MMMRTSSAKKSNRLEVCGYDLEEVRVLGAGGQGSVSLCKDTESGQLFALKTAAAFDELANEYETIRFLMDSGLREGIVRVHSIDSVESGPHSGQTYLLMDFCDQGDLMSELKRHPGCRLEERQAAAVVRSIAESLSRCHELGVMHRDIKPENILVSRGSHAVVRTKRRAEESDPWSRDLKFLLADFGLACEFQKGLHIRDGYVIGTNQYVAPEMLTGAYDERADVWSLGMVLHLLLTGDFPSYIQETQDELEVEGCYDDDTLLYCTMKACPNELDLAAPMYSHLSEGARSLLVSMLQKKPHRRSTASEVRAHPWVQPEVVELSRASDSAHDLPAAVKRLRFTMSGISDMMRERGSVQVETPTVARMARMCPLVLEEEVQFIEFNPLALLAAF